jgi:hypothetical protein
MNNQAIFCVTEKGIEIAKEINKKIPSDIFVIEKFNKNFGISFTSLKNIVNENFFKYKYLVFIMATGIVTRIIAPYISKKDIEGKCKEDMIIMHPLPRVDEINIDLDTHNVLYD